MSNHKSKLSENVKEEIAKELGIYYQVKSNGWKDVSSKDCGNIVKKAIENIQNKQINQ